MTSLTATAAPATLQPDGPMTHREVLEALSGLLIGMFVAMLSSTVVTNALPRIIGDLGGGESAYTWVVTATLLSLTATTPIWGKLADLFSRKMLVQLSLVIFVIGSALAGLAPSVGWLIGARAVQGIGAGGLTALVQVVMAAMISPRERGRYSGYLGAVFALATVSGPLLGGLIVDTSWLGWRWCFGVSVPFAVLAFFVLQKTLHLPQVRRQDVSIDFLGAGLIVGGVSLLLVWVSLAGHQFAWASIQTALMVTGGIVLLVLAVVTEMRHPDPVIPLRLFRDRNTSLATVASLFVGVTIFGATVFLSQYFQISRGMSPTVSGLMSLPLVGGLLLSSILAGRRISRTGRYKKYVVCGSALVLVGTLLLATIDAHTDLWLVGAFMTVLGIGLGATMQNLVLAVQNTVAQSDMGAASSTVSFFRSLGGAVGVSVLGALLGTRVADHVISGLAQLGIDTSGARNSRELPDLAALPAPVRAVFEDAYGLGVAHTFLLAAPIALLTLIAVVAMREVPLRQSLDLEHQVEPAQVVETVGAAVAGRR
ncbi:MAG: MDR family MFS transporter [Actinomycetes bacterium]